MVFLLKSSFVRHHRYLKAVLESALVCVEFSVHHHNFKSHRTLAARPSHVYVLEPGPEAATLDIPVIANPFQVDSLIVGPSGTCTAQKRPSDDAPSDMTSGNPPPQKKKQDNL